MKNSFRLMLVIYLITSCISSFGQISVGVKAGVNFNSFRESQEFKNYFDVIPGFNAGAFATYPVLDFLKVRAELLYMQQGANLYDYRVMPELERRKVVARIHTLQVPILAELCLPSLNEDVLQPKLLLGGFYSYAISSTEHFVNHIRMGGLSEITYEGSSDLSDQFLSSQYGIIGALVAQVEMFKKPVQFEVRYQYNLNRLNKAGTQQDFNLVKTHTSWGDKLFIHSLSLNVSVPLYNF